MKLFSKFLNSTSYIFGHGYIDDIESADYTPKKQHKNPY